MDTTHYTFQTRKIKASGGAELVTFVPAVQPAPKARTAAESAGEILDFDLCRRRMETRAAWKDLTAAAKAAGETREVAQEQDAPIPYRPTHARRKKPRARAPWVDILTSAMALALVCLVGAAALLSIV